MRILECDLQLVSVRLQRAQEVLREAAWKQRHTAGLERWAGLRGGAKEGGRLTQLVPAERQTGGVLVQVLVEVDAQVAQFLLDGFDLLSVDQNLSR